MRTPPPPAEEGVGEDQFASRSVLDPEVCLEVIRCFKQGSEMVHLHFNKISLAS